MSTAVSKAIYERTQGESYFDECIDKPQVTFSFSACFNYHFTKATQTSKALEKAIKEDSSAARPVSGKENTNASI